MPTTITIEIPLDNPTEAEIAEVLEQVHREQYGRVKANDKKLFLNAEAVRKKVGALEIQVITQSYPQTALEKMDKELPPWFSKPPPGFLDD